MRGYLKRRSIQVAVTNAKPLSAEDTRIYERRQSQDFIEQRTADDGSDLGAQWAETESRGSKIVFIGQNLPKGIFIEGLEQCLV